MAMLTGSPPAHVVVQNPRSLFADAELYLDVVQLLLQNLQIECRGRTISAVGLHAAFEDRQNSGSFFSKCFTHARSLRAAFSIVNGRNLILRFQLADIGPIHAMLPAVDAACSTKDYSSVQPALWREPPTVEPRRRVRVWRALCAVADGAMTDPHVYHDAIASL